ncbi:MAG: ABC transporter ATP-binding protein [Pseudomonadota bacterium]
MSQVPHALEIRGLQKSFDGQQAVNALDLQVRAGEFYALLGPNGAGKTTTLRMVAGLLKPDAGDITVCGTDVMRAPIEAKRRLAWVPDEPLIYDKLTPIEYLDFVAGLWGMQPDTARFSADQLLDQFGLSDHADVRCQGFSKGMRQKVALAGALIHEPQLIILDEPLTGLDASSARQVKTILRELVTTGVTVIMTTHILEVAERMSDRIGVIAQGRLVAEGTLAELQASRADNGSCTDVSAGENPTGDVATSNSLEDVFLTIVAEAQQGSERDINPSASRRTAAA